MKIPFLENWQKVILNQVVFDMNGGWSPWYTVHKVMAGLLDAYMHCDNTQALMLLKGMADWTANTLKDLSPRTIAKDVALLNTEV